MGRRKYRSKSGKGLLENHILPFSSCPLLIARGAITSICVFDADLRGLVVVVYGLSTTVLNGCAISARATVIATNGRRVGKRRTFRVIFELIAG